MKQIFTTRKNKLILNFLIAISILLVTVPILNNFEIWFAPTLYLITKDVLEILYFFSGIVLIFGLYIGYLQFKLASTQAEKQNLSMKEQLSSIKDDIKIRNERLAVEKSMDYLELFANSLLPKINQYQSLMEGKAKISLDSWNPKENNYTLESAYLESVEVSSRLVILQGLVDRQNLNLPDIFNQLEFFSAGIYHGLAKEEIVFVPISHLFCEFINNEMLFLCTQRGIGNPYENTVKLFDKWTSKKESDTKLLQIKEYQTKIDIAEQEVAATADLVKPQPHIGG